MASKIQSDIEITKDDQNQINQFSRINMHWNEKNRTMQKKNEILNQLDDAATELELCDDEETVQVKYGDCFFHVKVEQAKQYVEEQQTQTKKETNEISKVMDEQEKKMKKLKAVLYTKFGNQINLEED
ncbi:prefoldin (macronuclear) [Tetrahymena thermophila SB210]|uniref:Prefoldin subunit 4 n=1 Tax=Tetrahymena thermophila (strain SB210) TaxID=312017 RepID=I7LTJ4_TETTS|nr:prefoldin [Tetrahymena thermophila SB210]EAR85359.3 prefoldin [Tetrahymena thermophila SB210]|eukprot:XP_001033022.3 prefoldin [Tetrahymena thermophila SB210]